MFFQKIAFFKTPNKKTQRKSTTSKTNDEIYHPLKKQKKNTQNSDHLNQPTNSFIPSIHKLGQLVIQYPKGRPHHVHGAPRPVDCHGFHGEVEHVGVLANGPGLKKGNSF